LLRFGQVRVNSSQEDDLPGEPLDFALLFREHYPRVYRYVRYRVDDDLIAEDLTSEIFERAYRYKNSFHPERGAFSTWIGRIAQNWVSNYLGSSRHIASTETDNGLENLLAIEPSPEAHMIGQQAVQLLHECLEKLSQRDKEIVALRFGMNTGNKQIAQIMNLKEHTVSVIIMRALERLRGCQEAE